MQNILQRIASVGAVLLLVPGAASAGTIIGAGSTFVQPIVAKWAEDYARTHKDTVQYQGVGSGAGIAAIEAGAVDFGATDKPLDAKELEKFGLVQFPIVVGAVVPVFNLPGIPEGKLRFSGQLLADIFLGKVTRWDAPEIKALNSRIDLPSRPITIVHRSDGSGTTYNWTDFLAKSSKEWQSRIGVGLTVAWPAGLAGKGNAGIAENVQRTPGAIGYVEAAYARRNKLNFGQVENSYRLAMSPTAEALEAAAATVDWKRHEHFSALMTNAGGPGAYPVAATTFILMPKAPKDRARSQAALAFFRWALEEGEKQATDLNFVPLPQNLIALIEAYWTRQGLSGTLTAGR